MISNINRRFGYVSNQSCIAPRGQYEYQNGNFNNKKKNDNNRRHLRLIIYDPHDIVSINE